MDRLLIMIAIVIAGLVCLSEVSYYMSHPYRHGVSGYFIALSVSVILIGVAKIIKDNKK